MENNLSRRFGSLIDKIKSGVSFIPSEYRRDRKKFIIKLSELCCVSLLTVSAVSYIAYMNCADVKLSVYADGEYIGTVDNITLAKQALIEARADIFESVQIQADQTCKITYAFSEENDNSLRIMTKDDLSSALYSAELSNYTLAGGIFADGKFVTATSDRDAVETLIDTVEHAVDSGSSKLMSELTIKDVYIPTSQLKARDEVISTLLTNVEYDNSSTDSELEGEILFSYAQDADKSYSANTDSDASISVSDDDPIYEKRYEVVNSSIPYQTIYEDSNELETGTFKVKTEGRDGSVNIVHEIVTLFGTEIKRSEVNTLKISDPVNQVILRGTKPKPKGITTGTFANPMKGKRVYTDMYGSRDLNGSYDFHTGVDFSAPKGTPVYAADGGKVILAGRNDSYGLCVIIRHSNGYDTLYAHLSKVDVKVGQLVDKGELVGKVGATGKAFGEHLHFEILIGKKRYDPMKFIPR